MVSALEEGRSTGRADTGGICHGGSGGEVLYPTIPPVSSWELRRTHAWILIIQAPPHTEGSWAHDPTSKGFASLTHKTVLLMRSMVMAAPPVVVRMRKINECENEFCKL